MARIDYQGLDEMLDEMKRLGELAGPTADRMLTAGADELSKSWAAAARKYRHEDSGDMIRSIGTKGGPVTSGNVRSIDVYPQGKDRTGTRNAEKAFILHYGTSRIDASHWVDDAEDNAEQPIQDAFLRIWDEHLKG